MNYKELEIIGNKLPFSLSCFICFRAAPRLRANCSQMNATYSNLEKRKILEDKAVQIEELFIGSGSDSYVFLNKPCRR